LPPGATLTVIAAELFAELGSATALAGRFPGSRFVGMDLSEHAVQGARSEAAVRGLANVDFITMDLGDFDQRAEAESYDFITTFDAVHDQARPLNVLKGIHRALRAGPRHPEQLVRGQAFNRSPAGEVRAGDTSRFSL
jgi:SAM-dependent methyltransferase